MSASGMEVILTTPNVHPKNTLQSSYHICSGRSNQTRPEQMEKIMAIA